jgi:hypothetical protein
MNETNPISGTSAIDGATEVAGYPQETVVFQLGDGQQLTLRVEVVREHGVYINLEGGRVAPSGAVIVLRGSQDPAIYKDGLTALRGMLYADEYYDDEIPGLEICVDDADWALKIIHDSGDGLDWGLMQERDAALAQIVEFCGNSEDGDKVKAARFAARTVDFVDCLGRENPMAAALVNVRLNEALQRRLDGAESGRLRVSKARMAVIEILTSAWRSFMDVDVELATMERWFASDRKERGLKEFNPAQAKKMSERVGRLLLPLENVSVAPYVTMPTFLDLIEELGELRDILADETRFAKVLNVLQMVRWRIGVLMVHRDLAKAMVPVGAARRFGRGLSEGEREALHGAAVDAIGHLNYLDIRYEELNGGSMCLQARAGIQSVQWVVDESSTSTDADKLYNIISGAVAIPFHGLEQRAQG